MTGLIMLDACYGERLRKARKSKPCANHCERGILAGQQYVECVEYPGGESGYADAAGHPVRYCVCGQCEPRRLQWHLDGAGGLR